MLTPEQIYGAWWPGNPKRTLRVEGAALPELPDGEPALLLSAITGEERLSTVCQYDLMLTTALGLPEAAAASIDIKALIGNELTVTIELEGMGTVAGAMNLGAGTREISGVVTEAKFIGRLNRQCRYAVVLKPWLALLDLSSDYRYDERGLLTQAQASAPGEQPSQVTFEYDPAGRRTSEMQAHHGQVWRIAHELDALGHRSSTHLPDAGTLTWQRYGSGHVHGVLFNGEQLAAFERDALHRETLRTQGAVAHHFAYSPSGFLASHRWQGIDHRGNPVEESKIWRGWEHDQAGQITALHDTMRDSRAYTYDPASRLSAVTAGRASEAFAYDPAGNLLAVGEGKPTHVGRAKGDRLLSLVTPELPVEQSPQYSYDGHGNRTSVTVPSANAGKPTAKATSYRYDSTHQLKGIEHAGGGASRYEYDALGRRTAKHHTDAIGRTATTLFVWDGDWMAQEVRAGQGSATPITYVSHPDHAGPLSKLEGAKAYHYATDHLGTPQELYDDQRQVVWAADLSAYGKTRSYLTHEIDNPIRFPGQYFDVESGLHYNRHRYYDPQAGRYINQDPIGLRGGWNQYAYAKSNPFAWFDPMGLQHVSGQWKDCGKGCRIRIDRDASGGGRHLHWECRGSSGVMGEFGGVSHNDDYNSAPNAIKDCARKNGFEPEPKKEECPKKNGDSSTGKAVVATGATVTVGYVIYRVVRMLPSLIPIFWETIPVNAAVP